LYEQIILDLDDYEKKNNAGKIGLIHGDTVLTNIIFNQFEKVKLIDMRGYIDGQLSIFGDIFYDWAKLYQSLIGYDEILNGKFISKNYKDNIISHFKTYFIKLHGKNNFKNLKLLTKSLLFSLIPLHNNHNCLKFYELITSEYLN
tara:strand:- start:239 stop:673 length:435 start_codon:yes stop_codon:yes gene_type:complete